jgi:hypothetical protein
MVKIESLWTKAVASLGTALIAEFVPPYSSTWQNHDYRDARPSDVILRERITHTIVEKNPSFPRYFTKAVIAAVDIGELAGVISDFA